MKSSMIRRQFVMMFLTLCVAGTAQAQYSSTPNPDGTGQIIVGNGTLGALNSTSTPVALSAGGFDQVTLNIGSMATASGVDTIAFTTSNDTLVNNGTVIGQDNASIGANGFNAISFTVAGALTGENVTNNGTATGGMGGAASVGSFVTAGNGGDGINFSGGSVSGITVLNTGNAVGGNGNAVSGGSVENDGGSGGAGILLSATGSINGVTVTNSGKATGGDGGSAMDNLAFSGSGGDAITFSANTISNVTFANSGLLTGGNGGPAGIATSLSIAGNGAAGVDFSAQGTLGNIALTNTGIAMGGNGGASNNPGNLSTGGNG
ncbi:MAG: hypothetical protein WCD79_21275, partial [Chthoniobacteraceae bacterium]